MSDELTIREAGASEARLIAALSRRTFYESFAAGNTPENMDLYLRETFTIEHLMAEVGAPGNTFLLAWQKEQALGYARLREEYNPENIEEAGPRAIAFYTQWGFTKFGQHLFVMGTDPQTDWLMTRPV